MRSIQKWVLRICFKKGWFVFSRLSASFLSGNLFFHFAIGFSQKWCLRPFLFLSSGPEMVTVWLRMCRLSSCFFVLGSFL